MTKTGSLASTSKQNVVSVHSVTGVYCDGRYTQSDMKEYTAITTASFSFIARGKKYRDDGVAQFGKCLKYYSLNKTKLLMFNNYP